MSDPQRSERVVESDGITVEKSFATDEFPVPAVTFRIESTRSEPVRVRLTDTIPEDFPMERVGFHPDFGSDNWTAYSDHRVEFERLIESGATVRTVYGIRGNGIEPGVFLSTPTVEHVPEGETIEDVLGADGSESVREVVAGDRDSLPGMDDGGATAAVAEDSESASRPAPRSTNRETIPAVTVADSEGAEADVADNEAGAAGTEADTADEAGDASDVDAAADAANADTDAAVDEDDAAAVDVSVASALAAEIRSGDVSEGDLETLREELDLGSPRSVDVRISRLQSRMEDMAAYADALEEFIDEEGTATEVLEESRERTAEVAEALAAAESRLEAAAEDRRSVREDVETVESTLDDALADLETLENRVADVEAVESDVERLNTTVSDLESTVGAVGDDVEDLDAEIGDVRRDVADLDARVHDLEDVDDDVSDLESEIDRIDEELAELEAFRDRLSDAFGT